MIERLSTPSLSFLTTSLSLSTPSNAATRSSIIFPTIFDVLRIPTPSFDFRLLINPFPCVFSRESERSDVIYGGRARKRLCDRLRDSRFGNSLTR